MNVLVFLDQLSKCGRYSTLAGRQILRSAIWLGTGSTANLLLRIRLVLIEWLSTIGSVVLVLKKKSVQREVVTAEPPEA